MEGWGRAWLSISYELSELINHGIGWIIYGFCMGEGRQAAFLSITSKAF